REGGNGRSAERDAPERLVVLAAREDRERPRDARGSEERDRRWYKPERRYGWIGAYENDDHRESNETRSERSLLSPELHSPRADSRGERNAEHHARRRPQDEVAMADRPAEKRSDRSDGREHGDAEHSVAP